MLTLILAAIRMIIGNDNPEMMFVFIITFVLDITSICALADIFTK